MLHVHTTCLEFGVCKKRGLALFGWLKRKADVVNLLREKSIIL